MHLQFFYHWHTGNRQPLQKRILKAYSLPLLSEVFFPALLFTKAQTRIDSALAGILNSLTPVFTLIVGLIWHQTKIKSRQIYGLLLGLVGAVGLIVSGKNLAELNINSYALFIVAATMCYGINVNTIKSYLTHLNGIQITSFSFMFIFPAALAYLLTTDFAPVAEHPDWPLHLAALATLGIVGTAFAMLLMNTMIRYTWLYLRPQ
ncbi:MAG: DMT family transporter [Bacteroidales bacterium]